MEKHISWAELEEKKMERRILAEYSSDEVYKHLKYLVTLTRIAGTDDELKAARYLKKRLDEYGIDAEIHEFDAFVSHPGAAKFDVFAPVETAFPCLSLAFITPTPPEGIEAEIVPVGKGFEADYKGVTVKGKIALVGPVKKADHTVVARIAEEMGAVAQIHINSGE